MMRLRCLLILAALLTAPAFAADGPSTEPSRIDLFDLAAPAFTTFSARDGVPEAVIVSVQTDAQGFVWLASPLGVARYDGHQWERSEDPAVQGSVANLMVDSQGTLWASGHDMGVVRYDGEHWHHEGREQGMNTLHLRRLAETVDAQGHVDLWALTFDSGLYHRVNNRWVIDEYGIDLPPSGVLSIARTKDLGGRDRLWVGSFNEGLWYREDGRWHRFQDPSFDVAQIEHLTVTTYRGREELWISAFGSGIYRLDDKGLRSWSRATGDLASDTLYDLAAVALPGGERVLWGASRAGLVRIYRERAQNFDQRHGLPSAVVRSLSTWRSPDGIDVLWLATEGGVARAVMTASRWQTASLMGAQGAGVFGVMVDRNPTGDERLWVGSTSNGLGLFERGRWRTFSLTEGSLPDNDVTMILRAPDEHGDDEIWLGLRYGHLLRVLEGPRFQNQDVPWDKNSGQAVMHMISRREQGQFERWAATRQSGVYRWRDGKWTAFRPVKAIGQWRTNRLLEQIDEQGRSWLWATSNQGLARFDGEIWDLFGADIGLPDTDLIGVSLYTDAEGKPILWLGSVHAGLIRVDVSNPRLPRLLPNDLPPAPDPMVYGAERDSRGRLYVCSNNGVQVLTPRERGYQSVMYSRHEGMVHEECNRNAQTIDMHDRFWTGTLGGLTVFDPNEEIIDTHAKPLALTHVTVDGVPVSTDLVRVPAGGRDLRVEFALLSWQRESESRLRTQLIGFDARPSAWTAQTSRSFSALPAGKYTLRIEGRDYAGNVSTPIELSIEIVPTIWERAWVRALLALGVIGLGAALLSWRTRSLEGQRQRLANEVASRTAELNQANARLLELSYKDALTGLANRRHLLEVLDAGVFPQDRPTSLIFVDVDHFKQYNDRYGHPAGDEALRCVAEALRANVPGDALVARYGGEEFACLLPGIDLIGARVMAELVRVAVSERPVPVPGTPDHNRVTISVGVACVERADAMQTHRLLREADIALYQAKNDGRNCVRG